MKKSKAENIRRAMRNAVQFGRDYPLRPEDRLPPTGPHRYSTRCHIALKCEACKQKWLEEHVDTLPDAAKQASLDNQR